MVWILASLVLLVLLGVMLSLNSRLFGGVGVKAGGAGAIVFLFLLVQGFSMTTKVNEGNVGVIYEFGAITGTLNGTGLQFHKPWANIHQVNIKDQIATFGDLYEVDQESGQRVRVRKGNYAGFDAASSETQSVVVAASLNFRVTGAQADDLLRQFGADWFSIIFENRMQTYIKAETTKFETATLPAHRAEVGFAVEELLRTDEAIVRSGIIIVKVTVDNFDLDDEFLQAIRDKQVAEQQAEKAKEEQKRLVTEAETLEQETVIQARADAEKVRIAAQADSDRQVLVAEGLARAIELEASAQAKANRELSASLTPDLLTSQAIQNLANVEWGLLPADSDFLLDPANIRSGSGF